MNYKDRYIIEVDSIRGDMDSPRKEWGTYSESAEAVQELNRLDRTRNVYLVDRANLSDRVRAYGYYNVKYRGDDIFTYVQGVIDREADLALDRLDRLVDEQRTNFERKYRLVWGAAELEILTLEWSRRQPDFYL